MIELTITQFEAELEWLRDVEAKIVSREPSRNNPTHLCLLSAHGLRLTHQ